MHPDEVLLLSSIQIRLQAIAIHQQTTELNFDLGPEFDDDDLNDAVFTSEKSLAQLYKMANDSEVIALFLMEQRRLLAQRGAYDQIKKCIEYFDTALSWPDRMFRHEFHLSRSTFDRFVSRLERNPIFQSQGRRPQRAVRYQLATFLMRYGSKGADAMSTAKQMGIGFGTVWTYCRRVTRALHELGIEVISWGNAERRRETANFIQRETGLEDCIGIIDGSLIRLSEVPSEWGLAYICRKKYPSVNIQAICDHEKRFISYDMGWPGSMTDVTILKNSELWRNRASYFSGDEYILADRGYPSSLYTLRPFTDPEILAHHGAERSCRQAINRVVSGIRIKIEHAFGLLKGRFPALQDLGSPVDPQDIYKPIQAMMVIHNLCIDWNDEPQDFLEDGLQNMRADNAGEDIDNEVLGYGGITISADDQERVAAYEDDEWHREAGQQKRQLILDSLFPTRDFQ